MTLFIALIVLLTALLLVPLLLALLRPAAQDATRRAELNVALFAERRDELSNELSEGSISAEQYEEARLELERDLLINADAEERSQARPAGGLAALVGIGVPLLAGIVYLQLGAPDFVEPPEAVQHAAGSRAGMPDMDMNALTERLTQRLEENPGDVRGWLLLARSMQMHQDFARAADIYERALQRAGEHPELLIDYAELLAGQQGSMQGKPAELVARALQLDPQAQGALWLAGAAAFEKEDYAVAIEHWQVLQKTLTEDEGLELLEENLVEARRRLENGG